MEGIEWCGIAVTDNLCSSFSRIFKICVARSITLFGTPANLAHSTPYIRNLIKEKNGNNRKEK